MLSLKDICHGKEVLEADFSDAMADYLRPRYIVALPLIDIWACEWSYAAEEGFKCSKKADWLLGRVRDWATVVCDEHKQDVIDIL